MSPLPPSLALFRSFPPCYSRKKDHHAVIKALVSTRRAEINGTLDSVTVRKEFEALHKQEECCLCTTSILRWCSFRRPTERGDRRASSDRPKLLLLSGHDTVKNTHKSVEHGQGVRNSPFELIFVSTGVFDNWSYLEIYYLTKIIFLLSLIFFLFFI